MTVAAQRAQAGPEGTSSAANGANLETGATFGVSENVSTVKDPSLRTQPDVLTGPILVVDDDAGIRMTVADILSLEGYPVVTAVDGVDALAAIDRTRPSLILLDMRMPVLDGWGVARTLQARGLNIPIVVMTAAHNARQWADEIAADAYISKPFELVELLDVVGRYRRPHTRES